MQEQLTNPVLLLILLNFQVNYRQVSKPHQSSLVKRLSPSSEPQVTVTNQNPYLDQWPVGQPCFFVSAVTKTFFHRLWSPKLATFEETLRTSNTDIESRNHCSWIHCNRLTWNPQADSLPQITLEIKLDFVTRRKLRTFVTLHYRGSHTRIKQKVHLPTLQFFGSRLLHTIAILPAWCCSPVTCDKEIITQNPIVSGLRRLSAAIEIQPIVRSFREWGQGGVPRNTRFDWLKTGCARQWW